MAFRGVAILLAAAALASTASPATGQDGGKAAGKGEDGKEPPPAKVDEKELEGDEKKAHDAEVKSLLQELLKEKNKSNVTSRIEQLGANRKRASRDALMLYARGNKNHEYVGKAYKALGRIGGAVVLNYLCGDDALQSYNNFLVQIAAAEALGEMKDKRAAGSLIAVIEFKRSKIEVISACCRALAKVAPKDEKARKTVMTLTSEKDDTVRANAVVALGDLGSDEAYARLVEVLEKDSNSRVRGAACTGLQVLGRRAAIPALQKAAKEDKSQVVKDLANLAITKLGG